MSNLSLVKIKNKAIKCLQSGKIREAEQLLKKLSSKIPEDPDIWIMRASISGQKGDFPEVIKCCKRAISIDRSNVNAYIYLGNAYASLGNANEALSSFAVAIELQPNNALAHNNLGNAFYLSGRVDEAITSFQTALHFQPHYPQALHSLGSALLSKGNTKDAVDIFRKTLEQNPGWIDAQCRLATSLRLKGALDEAMDIYKEVLTRDPENAVALSGISNIYLLWRDLEKSVEIIKKLIQKNSLTTVAIETYAHLCGHFDQCDDVIKHASALLSNKQISVGDQASLYFSRGYVNDKKGDYDQAFDDFCKANDALNYSFDREEHTSNIDRIILAFNSNMDIDQHESQLNAELPVFIVGMPRSGTSLAEQILASHSDVYGAGELLEINRIVADLPRRLESDEAYPACVLDWNQEKAEEIAEQYLAHLDEISPQGALRVTDKLPTNFLNLGVIDRLFPGARVIHCQRNPLDTCLSIFFQNFSGAHPYSTKLGDIAHYYKQYRRLMDHWQNVLGLKFFDLEYEILVSEFETTSRELVAFCGLEWQEQCLHFFDTDRQTITASFDQVRQPIYRKSLQRWQNYRENIPELVDALSDC
ncbi:MAG: sulfotransferase [Gammaproteobacteria bacterium]|nr:sulfotransferase [Gammaproteobacteria bacterium]